MTKEDFRRVAGLDGRLLKLGTPVLFPDVIISVGRTGVQYVVNGYGFLFVAGFTATNKLYGILEMAAISYGYAIVTYVGQKSRSRGDQKDKERAFTQARGLRSLHQQ